MINSDAYFFVQEEIIIDQDLYYYTAVKQLLTVQIRKAVKKIKNYNRFNGERI